MFLLQTVNLRLLLLACCLALTLGWARAETSQGMQQLESIHALADRDNEAGLKQLQEYKARLPGDADRSLRADTQKTLIALLYSAGKTKEAEAANAELLNLGKTQHDRALIAYAQIGEIINLLDEGKGQQVLTKLDELRKAFADVRDPETLLRLNIVYGAAYQSSGKFEPALTHYLEALRLSDLLPRRRVQAKLYRLEALANLYITMHNAEQALATANDALELAKKINNSKTLASLGMVQGLALTELDRHAEALDAYHKVLKISREAGLVSTEATALQNIADHHLRMKNFVEAEKVARLALGKVEALKEKSSIANAKINIGFALAGQGKMAQGMALVNEGNQYYRDAGAKSDVEAVLGEVGRMYESAGMYKDALATVREQQKLSDELFRSDRARTVAQLQEQFDANQRKKQIELLARENDLKDADIRNRRLQLLVTLLGALLTVAAGIFIFLLYRKVRRTNAKLMEMNQQLEFHAVRDPLTGLYNRRSFVDMMKARVVPVDGERREEGLENPDCLMLMDIDHFKHINDTYGHAVGDSVLMEVAHRLKKSVRESDMVLRWGGEEFLIYSPHSNPAQLKFLVERVLRAIGETPMHVGDLQVPVTLTAGFITLPFSGIPEEICNWEKALQIADMALYLGKTNGRNRAYGVAGLLIPQEQALPVLEHDLAAAIKEGMVELVEVHGPEKVAKPANGKPEATIL